jgi:hypothetical protein
MPQQISQQNGMPISKQRWVGAFILETATFRQKNRFVMFLRSGFPLALSTGSQHFRGIFNREKSLNRTGLTGINFVWFYLQQI